MKQRINIAVVLTISIIPDIDLLIPFLYHGGPTHSIIILLALALPAIIQWKMKTIPYIAAMLTHPLIGDYLTRFSTDPEIDAGIQLLFPISQTWFSAGTEANRQLYTYIELALFAAFLILLLASKDLKTLIKPHKSNLILIIPLLTAALPVFFEFPIRVPPALIIPHLILIILLIIPILTETRHAASNADKADKQPKTKK